MLVADIEALLNRIRRLPSLADRLQVLERHPEVKGFAIEVEDLTPDQQYAIKALIALRQGPIIFQGERNLEKLKEVADQLLTLEEHYAPIGGIVGYHLTVARLLEGKHPPTYSRYLHPPGIDLRGDVSQQVMWGLENLPKMGEIYPVGGAGDRLGLDVPAARLPFGGRTLLEGLIRDLQAREYLYTKVFGKEIITPIAMMTSHEKDNHRHILSICQEAGWFGRPKESFTFFTQESVPVLTKEGNWAIKEPYTLMRKPGGHGVIWRLMEESGTFDWFAKQGRTKALVRQINNPIAGVDSGLLAFVGIGFHEDKAFGFATCDRRVGAHEGSVILCEKKQDHDYLYGITNIEYTDFEQHGLVDEPVKPGSDFSKFPANTNILFVDLKKVQKAECTLPGMLINMKQTAQCLAPDGTTHEVHIGRLETTMQNVADHFVARTEEPIETLKEIQLPTYVTYNAREKTLSVTKKMWKEGDPIHDTPVGAEYERYLNNRTLLNQCNITCPENFHLTYHPALGPLFSVIAQKIQGGKLHAGAELQLEIAELQLENLDLHGSLLINSTLQGKCRLINVTVENQGIDWEADNVLWENKVHRKEALEIVLEGNGEFHAENVTFHGDERIVVPDGHIVIAKQTEGGILLQADPLEKSWGWDYQGSRERIVLKA